MAGPGIAQRSKRLKKCGHDSEMLKISLLALSAVACATAFTPSTFLPNAQLQRCRPAINLRMTATEPAAPAQIGKRAEYFSASFAHPQPVGILHTCDLKLRFTLSRKNSFRDTRSRSR